MAVVIADAGPLIALAKIGYLELLTSLFSTVRVTRCVVDECLCGNSEDARLIHRALENGWLLSVESSNPPESFSRSLGAGEQSSIAYALQCEESCLLILDDALARKHALRKHLQVVGTAAILFAAQRKGLVADAEKLITNLNQIGYRISPKVIAQLKGE